MLKKYVEWSRKIGKRKQTNLEEYDDDEYDENELAKVPLMEKYVKQHLECFIYLSKLYVSFFDEFIDNDSFVQFIEDRCNILGLIDDSIDIDIIINNKNEVLQYVKDIHKCYLENGKLCE